ncbi:transcription-repair coupling factor (superfamily II helicase) [Rhizobium sp. BK529]|uniref:DEAD/DEAH box helicase n=1 Tax=Rhizobium sp. BK529 TaxID=2586983 RepID=UPI001805C221|nr:DEAD/DEAH box helicase [Rhizobium sp. BK529]MBB3595878.1 transcription-repair coupling factor (superfamily II helicase) [Rhizobium sp. BK529]
MRTTDLTGGVPGGPDADLQKPSRLPAAFVADRLLVAMGQFGHGLVYVALSEGGARAIVDAVRCLDPRLAAILLPPWDCLPFDRVPPSRQSMGRRMEALWQWAHSEGSRLLVTSLDAMLQRVPPAAVIAANRCRLRVGEPLERSAFEHYLQTTGYIEDSVVDDHGEYSIRGDVIDIFPAGGEAPIRVLLSAKGAIAELRIYDALTQRTRETVDTVSFGPASEAILSGELSDGPDSEQPPSQDMERRLFSLYGSLQTVFEAIGDVPMIFAAGSDARAESYHAIIDDARQAHRALRGGLQVEGHSLYLDRKEWQAARHGQASLAVDFAGGEPVPMFYESPQPRRAFADFIKSALGERRKLVLAGRGEVFDNVCKRVERMSNVGAEPVFRWSSVKDAAPGALLTFSSDLHEGFFCAAHNLVVLGLGDIVGPRSDGGTQQALAAPDLQIGDAVVHEDHGIGILRDLESLEIDGMVQDAVRLEYRDGASVLVPMEDFDKIWRYGGEPDAAPLDRLHTEAWAKRRKAILRDIALAARHLRRLAKQRQETKARLFVAPPSAYQRFVARFPYLLTRDQSEAIEAVMTDLASGRQMSRLVCGDVGFGKTEIALRAAAAVALCGSQVAIIAPTTVLARQHFRTFERRFEQTDIRIAMLSRLVTANERAKIKEGLADGKIDIVVATQAILARDLSFADLALVVIDEEQRLGTRAKQKIKNLSPALHRLTMSATPIPRTLQAAMAGLQDVSLLNTSPARRRPVRTFLVPFDPAAVRAALLREYRRGGQSFVIVPRIEDIDHLAKVLREIVPEMSVRTAHGKMRTAALDGVVVDFADGDGDILLSTNIIENGLDVPRANTILIWQAHRFGLSQLHQLRGRVGRGQMQAFAYLLTEPERELPEEARLRLSALIDNDRLGAGISISLQDLDIRGGGDITGEDQAGHMRAIGVGLYQKLLEDALDGGSRSSSRRPRSVSTVLGETGSIPASYVCDPTLRLNLYIRLAKATSAAQIEELAEEFEDRFGELPQDVLTLLRIARLKIIARERGIYKLEAGPSGLAIRFAAGTGPGIVKKLAQGKDAVLQGDRLVFARTTATEDQRIAFFEDLLGVMRAR